MNWKTLTLAATVALHLGPNGPVWAEETVDHYVPEPSETLAEAVENFTVCNRRLSAVLAREPLTVADMEEVHELTYTLEVALARINEELGALPGLLEQVHLTSEGDDPQALREVAGAYLAGALAFGG